MSRYTTNSYFPSLCNIHNFINIHLCLLEPQGGMLLAWQKLVQERLVPLLCPSSSHCWPRPRGCIPSSSPLPGSWHFRSLSSLRPLAPALVLSVVRVCRRFSVMQMTFRDSVPDTRLISVAAVIVGGIDMMSQSLVLAKKPHIVIGETTVSISFHVNRHFK